MPTLLGDLMTREWTDVVAAQPTTGHTPAAIADGLVATVRALRDNELFVRIVELDPELLLPYLLARRGRSQEAIAAVLAEVVAAGQADGSVRKAFQNSGGGYVFSGPKDGRKLEVNLHGTACGSYGADECLRAWRWDGAANAYVETPNSKGLALLVSGSIPALEPDPKDAPAAVQAEVAARTAACKALGVEEVEAIPLSDLPDVNGDGVRDWLDSTSARQ